MTLRCVVDGANFPKIVYTTYIKPQNHQEMDPHNNQEIVLDIAENLTQIGKWTLEGFQQRQTNITLFLHLTRKNINALSDRELGKAFRLAFDKFCKQYDKQEKEYKNGISDHKQWANMMHTLASGLHTDSRSL